MAELYLEDFTVGRRFISETHRIDSDQIKAFAEQLDVQTHVLVFLLQSAVAQAATLQPTCQSATPSVRMRVVRFSARFPSFAATRQSMRGVCGRCAVSVRARTLTADLLDFCSCRAVRLLASA